MSKRRQSRKGQRKEKRERLAELEARKWRPFEALLTFHGLEDGVRLLSQAADGLLWRQRNPDPIVIIEPSAQKYNGVDQLKEEMQNIVTTVLYDEMPVHVTVMQCLDFSTLLRAMLRVTNSSPKRAQALRARVIRVSSQINEFNSQILDSMCWRIDHVLMKHSNFIDRIFWAVPTIRSLLDGRRCLQIEIGMASPQRIEVITRNHGPRVAFRCGEMNGRGIQWLTWPATAVGKKDCVQDFPVYIQKHAIDRVHERVSIPLQEGMARELWQFHVRFFMARSLAEPHYVRNNPNGMLIEYQFFGYRLGYFVAQLLSDKVVITTFLFLTMHGTPEAEMLRQKLRLTRPDIEHTFLDELSTFVCSDIRNDPILVHVIKECGCGSLVELGRHLVSGERLADFARELKKYLGTSLLHSLKKLDSQLDHSLVPQ